MLDKRDDYAQRPMRYRDVDGLWEMGIGFLWLGIVLVGRLRESANANSFWHWRGTYLLSLAVLLFVVLYGVEALKKRITYLRTGFVKYRRSGAKPWVAGAISGAIAIVASIFLLPRFTVSVTVAVASVMWGLFYAFATKLDAAWRWVVLVVMVAGPVAISTLPIDRQLNQALSIGFLGLSFFVSGAITLYLYLRRTRPAVEGAE